MNAALRGFHDGSRRRVPDESRPLPGAGVRAGDFAAQARHVLANRAAALAAAGGGQIVEIEATAVID